MMTIREYGCQCRNHLGSLWRAHTLIQGSVKPAAFHLCVLPVQQDRRLCLARCAAAKHRLVFLGTPEVRSVPNDTAEAEPFPESSSGFSPESRLLSDLDQGECVSAVLRLFRLY